MFKNGIPVHDTIARIISGIKPEPFQAAFVRRAHAINQHTDGALVAIDGKTLSSYDREDRTSTIHMVSAYAAANKLVLGQIKTDAKSNEIIAIPELLALLDITGCLVSIDTMECQTEIARTILQQGGDYLLAVKGNQPKLFEAVRQALAPLAATLLCAERMTLEKAHIGVDAKSGLTHSLETTAANEHDLNQVGNLLHGKEEFVFGDAGYQGAHKREELAGVKVEWAIAERPGKVKTLKKHPRKNKAIIQFERLKASIRAKVEHPFRLIKRQFGFVKARYKGPMKNDNQLANLFRVDQLIRAQERST